jgi:hypothetical protein
MRHQLRSLVGAILLLGLAAASVLAATTSAQLVNLARAGVDDDVLIALIETDGSTFQLNADDILALHQQGLSDRVIRAMQETARRPEPAEAPPPPMPAPTSVAPIVPLVQEVRPIVNLSEPPPPAAIYPVAARVRPVEHSAPPAPVYWGWGGQRRPDSWDDAPTRRADAAEKKTDSASPQKK